MKKTIELHVYTIERGDAGPAIAVLHMPGVGPSWCKVRLPIYRDDYDPRDFYPGAKFRVTIESLDDAGDPT